MTKKIILLVFLLITLGKIFGQNLTQNIRGVVVDEITSLPVVGASVVLLNQETITGTITDPDGLFILEDVPLGRQSIEVRFIGYLPAVKNNLLVISGKELVVTVKLKEAS